MTFKTSSSLAFQQEVCTEVTIHYARGLRGPRRAMSRKLGGQVRLSER